MTTLEIWLLAISLAMDCFTVSITSGIIMRRILRPFPGCHAAYRLVCRQPIQSPDRGL